MSGPIIITVPNSYLMKEEAVDVAPAPSRKRRLDHLSWEEKMQRKKMKNRVAAQTSRDRKKAKMDEMEFRIEKLEERNDKLMNEVESLRALNERLISENDKLRAASARIAGETQGPAESPQQKDGSSPAIRAARLLAAMILLSQTSSHTSTPPSTLTRCISSQTNCSRSLMLQLQERLKMSKSGKLENALKDLKWWGPQQSNWNPVKVAAS